jgi:hypothetical protein
MDVRDPDQQQGRTSAAPSGGRACACSSAAFLAGAPLRSARTVAPPWTCGVQMRARRPRKGPSRTPADKAARFEDIGAKFGVRPARPGQVMDEKIAREAPSGEQAGYNALVELVGQDALDTMEKGVFVALAVLFSAFLASGLAISSLAAFKATGKPIPDGWNEFVSSKVEGAFTPSLFVFFGLSSLYGLYKQAQLNAGTTGYKERQ